MAARQSRSPDLLSCPDAGLNKTGGDLFLTVVMQNAIHLIPEPIGSSNTEVQMKT